MSLAARCPACATVFRVVEDQLRVSEGWVRCGRCAEVFNAIETLVDLDVGVGGATPSVPGSLGGGTAHTSRVMEDLARVAGGGWQPPPPAPATAGPESELEADYESEFEPEPEPEAEPEAGPAARPAPAPADDAAADDAADPAPMPPPAAVVKPVAAPPAAARPAAADAPLPTFLRQADRAARWRRPKVRAALAAGSVLAALLLALQAALAFRDSAAARLPVLRPLLAHLCAVAGCRLAPPRGLDALVVESSGLVRVEGTALYRLSVVLRNRATWALAPPSLDLTLTDVRGEVVARRVLALAELGFAGEALPAASEVPLQATLGSRGAAVSGYTIDLFYP